MLARVCSSAVIGVDAYRIDVEVDQSRGLPHFATVGLAEGAVRESRVRVESALRNCSLEFPRRRITVNLAPADVRKAGTAFDLPIALGLVSASEPLEAEKLASTVVVGELGLNGEVRPVPGVLSMALMARSEGIGEMVCPAACAAQASVVGGVRVLPVNHLREAVLHFAGEREIEPLWIDPAEVMKERGGTAGVDFAEVRGQQHVKRALEVAAAGGHNLLLVGPPGTGKTMLARRLPTIMPALSFEEAIETTKVYSIMGLTRPGSALVTRRPFRAPHHTVSDAGLVGGGPVPRPGEVSLAHNGVLFLDELPEFRKNVLEVLRQPLEDEQVTIARASMSLQFPAKIMLVAAMNPCPCGYLTDPDKTCLCSPQSIQRYRARVSGPLLDRIDIQVEVPAVPCRDLMRRPTGESSAVIRGRVVAARRHQSRRFQDLPGVACNARMGPASVQKHCVLADAERALLERAVRQMGFSARAYERILKVSRTIADLEGADRIASTHLAEAIQYRSLDRDAIR
ncbi:MAG: YifB family Mg chelatase-like AAA ATPase [Deltaproteobacteria bacterium]|nr:YifB family Mg chelatase-like AAA ATPase [Deltaproteobacteria bacterium]